MGLVDHAANMHDLIPIPELLLETEPTVWDGAGCHGIPTRAAETPEPAELAGQDEKIFVIIDCTRSHCSRSVWA